MNMPKRVPKKKRNRHECPHFIDLEYDYSCGASEAHCGLNPIRKEHSLYCIHEGHPMPCPLDKEIEN